MINYFLKLVLCIGREDIFVSGEGFTFNIAKELLRLKFARYLLSIRTDLVGTIRRTSRGFPHIDTVRLGQGYSFKLANADVIVICRHVDNRDVCSLSTTTARNDVDIPKIRFNAVENIEAGDAT